MALNGKGAPVAAPVVMPIVSTMLMEHAQIGVVEERDPLSGRTFRELRVMHPNGTQWNLRFHDMGVAARVGGALIKSTPMDERGVKAPTPLQDSMRELAKDE